MQWYSNKLCCGPDQQLAMATRLTNFWLLHTRKKVIGNIYMLDIVEVRKKKRYRTKTTFLLALSKNCLGNLSFFARKLSDMHKKLWH